jgi:hypothetical protein
MGSNPSIRMDPSNPPIGANCASQQGHSKDRFEIQWKHTTVIGSNSNPHISSKPSQTRSGFANLEAMQSINRNRFEIASSFESEANYLVWTMDSRNLSLKSWWVRKRVAVFLFWGFETMQRASESKSKKWKCGRSTAIYMGGWRWPGRFEFR